MELVGGGGAVGSVWGGVGVRSRACGEGLSGGERIVIRFVTGQPSSRGGCGENLFTGLRKTDEKIFCCPPLEVGGGGGGGWVVWGLVGL